MNAPRPSASSGFQPASDFAFCLIPMLDALGWRGAHQQLSEALPYQPDAMGYADFMNVMANLKFEGRSEKTRLSDLDPRLLPCLFIPEHPDRHTLVLLKSGSRELLVFDGGTGVFAQVERSPMPGEAVFFRAIRKERNSPLNQQEHWFRQVLNRFRHLLILAFLVSFILSLLAMVAPAFVMTIYDQVLSARSESTLLGFVAGALGFFALDGAFRFLRSWLLGFVSVRMSHIVGTEILRRILFLPPAFTESASLGAQVSRIRDFETIRDFIAGQAIISLFDLPFILTLYLGLLLISPALAFAPLGGVLLLALAGLTLLPVVQRHNADASEAVSKRKQFLVELLTNMRAIHYTGSSRHWLKRYEELSSEASTATFRAGFTSSLVGVVSQTVVTLTGVFTMTLGVLIVMDGALSVGGLMAAMMLVWRILAPMRPAFDVLTQLGKVQKSLRQVDRLMNLRMERAMEASLTLSHAMRGTISLSQVSLRYSAEAYPALLGVGFDLAHGETLLIVGHDGAGKSTILKLLLGMYQPQAGRVVIDHQNVRQFDPVLLRRTLGYSPQNHILFYGTIAQNLRFSHPSASMEEMERAARQADLLEEIEQFPEQFETRIGDHNITRLSASFKRRLSLARAFLRRTPVLLLDEPDRGLNTTELEHLRQILEGIKGESTLILVSGHPLLAPLADKILWLENGRVRAFGPKDRVWPDYTQFMNH
ncbi:MAG: ATP-binding cassette domain-containing protein [Magnetococcales bacterium]|nr:ATP-binding cassette domain-containing protein [Magnetococcales bacterium]MBF0150516.1 ATP-binding cassette domain-containing protein [Magnetococcales bacterium]